ncbi:phosphatase PAP2 family protein [Deltaproteobacteria bacterium TL4]
MEAFLWSNLPADYQILLTIQQFRQPLLNYFFTAITSMGSTAGYIVFLTLCYWSYHKKQGQSLAFLVLFSGIINLVIKEVFQIPRPYDPAIQTLLFPGTPLLVSLDFEATYSFLSGHTQGSVVLWGFLVIKMKQTALRIIALLLILLIPFSRLYLGVHFPQDILGGYVVGGVILGLWLLGEKIVVQRELKLYSLYLLIGVLATFLAVNFPQKAAMTALGALLGLGAGFVFEEKYLNFSTRGSFPQKLLRGGVGLGLVTLTHIGLSLLFKSYTPNSMALQLWAQGIRYGLLGLVSGLGIPWVLVKIHLADKNQTSRISS